jgi:D-amino-acid oxidase
MLSLLSVRPETGVSLRRGRILHRTEQADPFWLSAVPRPLRLTDLPAPYAGGLEYAAPVVHMPTYLPWLVDELAAAGVSLWQRELADLGPARAAADLVVNATGLGARVLTGDAALTGVRGQVVRVADPGLAGWTEDEEHPDGTVYVIPRGHDVVCGGVAEPDAEDPEPDPKTAAAILERCVEVVPELAGAPVLSHGVGIRPVRPEVRLERDGDVIHCYGHGGAGVTLSWGCAEEVVRLVPER